jgi:hypothetical protein
MGHTNVPYGKDLSIFYQHAVRGRIFLVNGVNVSRSCAYCVRMRAGCSIYDALFILGVPIVECNDCAYRDFP